MNDKQIIKAAMRLIRAKVKPANCARTPEQLRNAIAARWPKRNGKVRKSTDAQKS